MANKKTSDYAALPGGVPNDAWLLDIANIGVLNYKGTSLEFKDYVNAGKVGGKLIDGGTSTSETLELRNNAIDNLGFTVQSDGILRSNVATYEAFVVHDDDIPNKKYVDDALGGGGVKNVITVTGDGQTNFPGVLSQTPENNATVLAYVRGQFFDHGFGFTVSGTNLTWLDPNGFTLKTTDRFVIIYDYNLGASEDPSLVQDVSVPEAAVTGDGTLYDVKFANQVQLEGLTYNATTGGATFQVDGTYSVNTNLLLNNLGASYTDMNVTFDVSGTPFFIWRGNPGAITNPSGFLYSSHSRVIKVNAGDTLKVILQISGSTKSIDVLSPSQLSINLLRRN